MSSIRKILIANRGEIAVRVIQTARRLGISTVAVYSDADVEAPHVALADEAILIGPGLVGESYLVIDNILDAARQTNADAIHPGYGFLSENADFADAVQNAGLIFIGPDAEAISLMGNKATAKRRMIEAGVPCVPGYEDADQSDERLLQAAKEIKFPIMVKAAAGGGGRGM
ncbi:MAG: biotin carboxylase N-terminal domain-containing protein, partial [Pseudomonadota bacterium]|nr:biotin carboxylase N-terminal domain-containing protein [Pseudomonadota bacterium]